MSLSGSIVACLGTAAALLKKGIVCVGHARPSRHRVGRYLAAAGTVLIVLSCTPARAGDLSRDRRQWWIDHYGLADAAGEPLVARAERVFSRVAAAADKIGKRPPKLVVVEGKGDPFASAIRDGSVILTLEGLNICYRGAVPEVGDSRLAFLLGHELAHLAKDDFWYSSAFAAVSSSRDDEQMRRVLIGQLEKTGGSPDFVRTQELQADSYGILYMTMAGYDPKAIIGPDGTNFFRFWVSQVGGLSACGDATHISPEARAEFVRTELQPVIDALPRFDRGVRLYRDGDYGDAASSFESFIEKYPGREVYNDLGASRNQLAAKALAGCGGPPAAVRLPAALDPETTARRLRRTPAGKDRAPVRSGTGRTVLQDAVRFFGARGERAECFRSKKYRKNLQEAISFLEEAEQRDAAYLPARINLSSALIMSGDYARAISVADEALKIEPNNREALDNKAVAERLFSGDGRDANTGGPAAPQPAAGPMRGIAAGFSADTGNYSFGPSVLWWPAAYAGIQASYGRGTFTAYRLRWLVDAGRIAGIDLYGGVGYLHVERETNVLGGDRRFSASGGEILAGAVLPLSSRVYLLTAVTANTIRMEKDIHLNGPTVPVTMSYNPVSVTASLVYRLSP